jgi:hypothetical protein
MTDAVPISLLFNFADASEADQAAQIIGKRLGSHGAVRAKATRLHPRLTGPEIAAGVLVTVTIIRGARMAVAELRKLVSEIRGLAADLGPGLASAYAEVGSRRRNIRDLVAEDLQAPRHPRRTPPNGSSACGGRQPEVRSQGI